jgi:hypothetical protein
MAFGNGTISVPLINYFWSYSRTYFAFAVAKREAIGFTLSIWGAIGFNTFELGFDRSTTTLSIYPVTSCVARRLLFEDDLIVSAASSSSAEPELDGKPNVNKNEP